VHHEYTEGKRRRDGKIVHGFFAPTVSPAAKYTGTIVLPINGQMEELVPHEVTHAVLHKMRSVHHTDDESLAMAVGVLSARIARKIGAQA
jgi:hypothetical protein